MHNMLLFVVGVCWFVVLWSTFMILSIELQKSEPSLTRQYLAVFSLFLMTLAFIMVGRL